MAANSPATAENTARIRASKWDGLVRPSPFVMMVTLSSWLMAGL